MSGGGSRNKLIVFQDGTYLELFDWVKEPTEETPMYVWAKKKPGLIDFALSSMPPSTAESFHDSMCKRLAEPGQGQSSGITYEAPLAGGRTRKDGVEVKWTTMRPKTAASPEPPNRQAIPTGVPFFCHDVTPRSIRVPYDDPDKTTHPCGAMGIGGVKVLVQENRLEETQELYARILGLPLQSFDAKNEHSFFELESPVRGEPCPLIITSPRNAKDQAWLESRGKGISGLLIRCTKGDERVSASLGTEGIASPIELVKMNSG